MAFIIPNATDTTSGNKFTALDQAEPDSLDFEILGNDKNGVIGGCEVSIAISGGNDAVAVAPGVVVINGAIYTIPGDPNLNLPPPPGEGKVRFDLVTVRKGSGLTVSMNILQGPESSTNPTYPRSISRLNSPTTAQEAECYVPDKDVVLAAIYRRGTGNILAGNIVDKRRSVQTPISYRGFDAPSASQGSVGDLYLRLSNTSNGESGLYIKRTDTVWAQLASVPIDPGVPVGSVITWVAPTDPNPSVWIECNGGAVGRTGAYSTLYSVLGTLYGDGDGSTTFNLPDFRGMFMAGLPAGGALATQTGNNGNSVVLSEENIPGHTHSFNHGHTGTAADNGTHKHGTDSGDHYHTMDHSHGQGTASGGAHIHFSNFLQNANNTGPNHYLRPQNYPTDGLIQSVPSGGDHTHTVSVPPFTGYTGSASSGSSGSTESGRHSHTVTINSGSGLISGLNRETPAVAVNIQPRTMYVRYFIRYA